MPTTRRVTVTLPAELVQSIDRLEKNRSRFIAEAVERELIVAGGRGCTARSSTRTEGAELADVGLDEWAASLPEGDEGLVDVAAGKPVRWTPGEGWIDGDRGAARPNGLPEPHSVLRRSREISR
jgi:hypothetical protein